MRAPGGRRDPPAETGTAPKRQKKEPEPFTAGSAVEPASSEGKKPDAGAPTENDQEGAPAIEAYRQLLNVLNSATHAYRKGDDRLNACLIALRQVARFLREDRLVVRTNLDEVLVGLGYALSDLNQGGKPALLFENLAARPVDENMNKKSGRATNQSDVTGQAALVGAVETLRYVQMPLKDALAEVAGLCEREGVKLPGGKLVTAERLGRINAGLSKRKSDAAARLLASMRRDLQQKPPETKEDALEGALKGVQLARMIGLS